MSKNTKNLTNTQAPSCDKGPTDDYLERRAAWHAGEIDDDRVRCQDCAKFTMQFYRRRACDEGLGIHPTILRRCLRVQFAR